MKQKYSDVPSDEEGRVGVFGITGEESLQELIKIIGDLILIRSVIRNTISIAEASSDGLINLFKGRVRGVSQKGWEKGRLERGDLRRLL